MTYTAPTQAQKQSAMIHDHVEGSLRCRLVQILFCNLLRKKDISSDHMECKTSLVSRQGQDEVEGVRVVLVLKRWDEQVIQCVVAFQSELIADVESFDPQVFSWLHEVSWVFEVMDRCPVQAARESFF